MSYYKITYESNSVEGLKAIQGSFSGQGTNTSDSASLATEEPAPPPQQSEENPDVRSGLVQAPPSANETSVGADFSDVNAFSPPPSGTTDSANLASGPDEEIPPPPNSELQNQAGSEAQTVEGITPPKQPASKGPKAP